MAPFNVSVPAPTLTIEPPVPEPGCEKMLPLSLTVPEIVSLRPRPPSASCVAPRTTAPPPETAPSSSGGLPVAPDTSSVAPAALATEALVPVAASTKRTSPPAVLTICALPAVDVWPKANRLLLPLVIVAVPALALSKKLIAPPALVMVDASALELPPNCNAFAPAICQVAPLSVIFEEAAVALWANDSVLLLSPPAARPTVYALPPALALSLKINCEPTPCCCTAPLPNTPLTVVKMLTRSCSTVSPL
ncbi:hypothetical protein D3C87_1519590 [compost metagenome]